MDRYHVMLGGRRTTVTMDKILSDYLALRLREAPETPAAHTAVRAWLQDRLDEHGDAGRIRVSQWLQGLAIEAIADKKISKAYGEWLLGRG